MIETLSLIDRDYFQQFGWRQAAIWAVEEPESSLHVSLEAQVAAYLAEIARDTKGRLQIIATTHSEYLIQYANKAHFLTKGEGGTRQESTADRREVLSLSAKAGVSRWVHPLLYMPLDPVVLCEGEQDVAFVSRALRLLKPKRRIRVVSLREFAGDDAGGVDRMLQYLKENRSAVQARSADAPLVVVIDWEANSKKGAFEKAIAGAPGAFVLVWPEDQANPDLGKSFRGIERFFSDRIIHEAEKRAASIGRTKKGTAIVEPGAYEGVKKILNEIVSESLSQEDLVHAQVFLQQVIERSEGHL
jgi:hypothetical protein